MNFNNKLSVLIFPIVFQMMFILLLNQFMFASDSRLYFKNIPFIIVNLLIMLCILPFSFKQVENMAKKETEFKTMACHMKDIDQMLDTLKSQRHQHSKHIQIIQALLYTGKYDDLKKYVDGIAGEYRSSNMVLRLGDPALTSVVNNRMELSARNNIEFNIKTHDIMIYNTEISSWDLSTVIGNILDNAIEAVMERREGRRIYFSLDREEGWFVFSISNNGPYIDEKTRQLIFKPGFSTKDRDSRGYGLFIVKKILNKYGGRIKVESDKELTTFTVYLPEKAKRV